MIEETGEVLAVQSDGVLVQTVRQSACSSCTAAKGCGQKLLASVGQGQRFEVLAENPMKLSVEVGDQVVLGLAETALLKASMLAYLLPLLLLAIFASLAEWLAAPEWVVVIAAIGGLAAGLFAMKWRVSGPACEEYQPQILRLVPKT